MNKKENTYASQDMLVVSQDTLEVTFQTAESVCSRLKTIGNLIKDLPRELVAEQTHDYKGIVKFVAELEKKTDEIEVLCKSRGKGF